MGDNLGPPEMVLPPETGLNQQPNSTDKLFPASSIFVSLSVPPLLIFSLNYSWP